MGDKQGTRWLLRGGVLGPVVFVVGFVIIGALRADDDPMRQFGLPDASGLLQRVAIVLAYGWIARVMRHFAREAA